MSIEIKLPELGENIASGVVANVLVKDGETVEKDQPLVELETDKAVIEVPAEEEGIIKEVKIAPGDEVKIGQVMFILEPTQGAKEESAPEEEEMPEEAPAPIVTDSKETEATDVESAEPASAPRPEPMPEIPPKKAGEIAPAAPSVRRFAREIGIDIHQVPGTGPHGRISIDDVKAYSKLLNKQRGLGIGTAAGAPQEPLPDFSQWGPVEHQPMNKVRETTARHLSYAWSTIPHVTQFDKADITRLETLRKKYAPQVEAAGGKLTITVILLKVIEKALKKFPQFNASIDMLKNEIILKQYYNIGVAVDTDRGLLVPVIKNVDRKSITELAVELTEISKKAREKKLTLQDMQGGNFSISNLGGIGGTGFTPVVNSPEVAILAVSRARMEPVYLNEEFVPRLMLPLGLSYDHRLIDGADAARFLRWVCEALEDPFLLSL